MMKKWISLIFMLVLMAGCGPQEEPADQAKDNLAPIKYETKMERAERSNMEPKSIGDVGGYAQSEQRKVNHLDSESGYTDPYTNEETEHIANELRKHKQIIQAQVASTEKEIVVGVMLTDDGEKKVTNEMVKAWVKEIVPDTNKEIIIFTDDAEWHHLKNTHSRFNHSNYDELDIFFNSERFAD